MRRIFTIAAGILLNTSVFATEPQLLVQQLNNQGAVTGTTYRLYAQLPNDGQSVHLVFGDAANPLHVNSSTNFYQHPYGGYSSDFINNGTLSIAPEAIWDSWITLAYTNNQGNSMWDIGIDFSDFNAGGAIATSNGGWFLEPSNPFTHENNHLVLLAQFTSTGIVSGILNLQGWQADGSTWQKRGLEFSTSNAVIFGCTDANAANYNPQAGWNDGSCEGSATSVQTPFSDVSVWEVFPNPLRENMINIRFGSMIDPMLDKILIDIADAQGKIVARRQISASQLSTDRKITLQEDLAAGTYTVHLSYGKIGESKKIVVTH
jgi:hypothetical protein